METVAEEKQPPASDEQLLRTVCNAMQQEFRAMKDQGLQFTAEWLDDLLQQSDGGGALFNLALGRLVERHGEDFSLTDGPVKLDVYREGSNHYAELTLPDAYVIIGWQAEDWQQVQRSAA